MSDGRYYGESDFEYDGRRRREYENHDRGVGNIMGFAVWLALAAVVAPVSLMLLPSYLIYRAGRPWTKLLAAVATVPCFMFASPLVRGILSVVARLQVSQSMIDFRRPAPPLMFDPVLVPAVITFGLAALTFLLTFKLTGRADRPPHGAPPPPASVPSATPARAEPPKHARPVEPEIETVAFGFVRISEATANGFDEFDLTPATRDSASARLPYCARCGTGQRPQQKFCARCGAAAVRA